MTYRILIVDDERARRTATYQKLFANTKTLLYDFAQDQADFSKFDCTKYDAIAIDIHLRQNQWNLSLEQAMDVVAKKPIVRPVVLISGAWSNAETHTLVSSAMNRFRGGIQIIQTVCLPGVVDQPSTDYAASVCTNIEISLDQFYQRSGLRLEPDDPINLLHISDPQFGDPSEENSSFLNEFDIATTLGDNDTMPHLVALTGDVAYSGQPEEFAKAKAWLERLETKLWPGEGARRDRFLIVPGNHDVNFRLLAAEDYKYSFRQKEHEKQTAPDERYRRFGLYPYREFVSDFTKDPRYPQYDSLCWANHSFVHLGLRFLTMNSAGDISARSHSRACIPRKAMEEVANVVKSYGATDAFNVMLSHHGPGSAELADGALECWPEVKQFLNAANVGAMLHGHGHAREAEFLSGQDMRHILRIMAPTTHLSGAVRKGCERRGFNLIRFLRKDHQVQSIDFEGYEWGPEGLTQVQSENFPVGPKRSTKPRAKAKSKGARKPRK